MKYGKIIFFILLIAIVLVLPGPSDLDVMTTKMKAEVVVVVDPGHGGPDGGAEATDGTLEKDLNLQVAQAVKKEGEKRGVKVILTRETDEGLFAAENKEQKWRKLEDLEQRKKRIEEANPDYVISIHMNCFWSGRDVYGAQVFYPKTGNAEVLERSEMLATKLQQQLIAELNDGSNRMQMEKGDVYLMENPWAPTVLIECGFLSNERDLANLKQMQWQNRIAKAIIDVILKANEI